MILFPCSRLGSTASETSLRIGLLVLVRKGPEAVRTCAELYGVSPRSMMQRSVLESTGKSSARKPAPRSHQSPP